MSATTQASPSAYAMPLQTTDAAVARSQSLTVVPPQRELGKAAAHQALTVAARELALTKLDERAVTRGTALALRDSPLQVVGAFIARNELNKFLPVGLALTGIGALLSGAVGVAATPAPNLLFLQIFLGGTAAFASIVPLMAGVVALGKLQLTRGKKRMVELAQLDKPLKRLAAATGVERAMIRAEICALRDKLHGEQLLSPEAIEALEHATDRSAESPQETARAARTRTFARIMTGAIDQWAVRVAEQTLAACEDDERQGLAQALKDAVFADRSRVATADYEARNSLYRVLDAAARGTSAISSNTTLAVTDAN